MTPKNNNRRKLCRLFGEFLRSERKSTRKEKTTFWDSKITGTFFLCDYFIFLKNMNIAGSGAFGISPASAAYRTTSKTWRGQLEL
jgi:lipid-A-disaccharide synthase-like uncharacterized protein